MADLVRVRLGDVEKNVGADFAKIHDLDEIDVSPRKADGSLRSTTRANGRKAKPKTTVAASAAAKKAAVTSAPSNEEK